VRSCRGQLLQKALGREVTILLQSIPAKVSKCRREHFTENYLEGVFFKPVVLAFATLCQALRTKSQSISVTKAESSGLLALKMLKHFAARSTIASPSCSPRKNLVALSVSLLFQFST